MRALVCVILIMITSGSLLSPSSPNRTIRRRLTGAERERDGGERRRPLKEEKPRSCEQRDKGTGQTAPSPFCSFVPCLTSVFLGRRVFPPFCVVSHVVAVCLLFCSIFPLVGGKRRRETTGGERRREDAMR